MSADSTPSSPVKGPVNSPSRPNSNKPSGLDPWAFLAALRRHVLLAIVLSTLLAGVAGAAVWYFLPPGHHTSTRVLHVASTPPSVLGDPHQRSDFQTFKQTQIALLRSRVVLNAALRSPKVANSDWLKETPEPLEWLEKEVKVTFPASPEIMHVSLSGPAEQIPILSVLVDAIIEAYLREIVGKDRDAMGKRHDQLKEIAARYEETAKRIRKNMEKLRELAGAGKQKNLPLMQELARQDRRLAVNDLTRLKMEIRLLKAQIAQAKPTQAEDERDPEQERMEQALESDLTLQKLKASESELKARVESDAEKRKKGAPVPVSQQRVIDEWQARQADVKKRDEQVRKATLARLKLEKRNNSNLGAMGMKDRLAELEGLEKFTMQDVERLDRELLAMGEAAFNLEDFRDELAAADGMRLGLTKKAEVLKIELEAPDRVSRLDQEPMIVSPDERMRKIRFVAMACAAAVVLVLLSVGFLEMRTQRVTSAVDVASHLGLTIIGVLPFYRASKGGAKAAQCLKESVDHARTVLLHQAQAKGLKVVMVTSATSGEGKTSLACHLAASLARAGCRTLLIDADLRKPDAHNVFNCTNVPGLCEVLHGEIQAGDTVQETGLAGLDLLPAGRCCDRALSALAQRAFGAILTPLRQTYDFIIIDSSPVLGVPDALMLGKHTDGVLFAVMQGETRTYRLATAADRFARLDAPILGMIVNGADTHEQFATGPYGRPTPSVPGTSATAGSTQKGGRP